MRAGPVRQRLLPLGIRGLRGRFILVFVLVAVLGASVAAWAGARQASGALTESSQQQHADALVAQVTAVAPTVEYPPSQDALDQLRAAVGTNSMARYQEVQSASGIFIADDGLLTSELRAAVGGDTAPGHTVTQRVMVADTPWLVIGAPVMITAPDGSRTPSGVEVYSAQDLSAVESDISALTRAAIGTSALVLPVAVLLALLASRTVLAPVRRLRTTARRLADGDLDARTQPRGVDELAQLTHTVNEMAESLQGSMVAMARMQEDAKRFAADVSHELRTPLSTLTAAVEILHDALKHQNAQSDDEAAAQESARMALIETRRLVHLVEDIMEIARFDAGTAPMRWESTDILTLTRDCVRARGWTQDVAIAAPDGADLVVQADRRRLDVVLANLVGNARSHGAPPVHITFAATTSGVRVTVTDSGPGIPEDVLPRIFTRFYKADAARTRSSGSGLGMAIAWENTRLHGGELTAANASGGGAQFTVWLPRAGGNQESEDR
ncbi:sensor histidine kinase [Ruania halotolerans]|uniref:sensor histidine kinase n=1 Tax=Ruania halotolerans TaxID=2897773 RepID=UPI001E38A688|nr:HAMP domain-containing sensor histidine kinase [Ruania halotolerans]UFU05356.1 HAMP domain-containing histidine kinase [Ruania halotolerans]